MIWLRKLSIAVVVFLVVMLFARHAAAEVTLVAEGRTPLTIYVSTEATAVEKSAAGELAKYLSQISGATFSVSVAPVEPPAQGVFIGAAAGAPPRKLAADEFCVRAANDRVSIHGAAPRGLSFAIYALLEDQLGCRWWSHDEEEIPSHKSIRTPDFELNWRPAFSIHNVWNREAQSATNNFYSKIRSWSAEKITGGHTLYPLLTSYANEHPEIYPQDKAGQRKWNDLHFCYLAPGIADALTEALSKQIAARNGNYRDEIFFAGMGDWYGGQCLCDKCQTAYEEEAWTDPDGRRKLGYTGTLLRMINRTAEQLEKRFPGVRVGTFAYMSLEAPPGRTTPRDNVMIRVPRLRHCTVHSARDCDKNRSFLRNVERWCQIAPGRVYIWDYSTNFPNMMRPFPSLFSMADNIKLYHELGVRGIEIQGNYVSTGGDLAVLKNYVWRKVMNAPATDPRATLEEFCRGYYGPAAADVLAYTLAQEASVREPKSICADEFAGPSYLTAEVRKALSDHRDQALKKVSGQQPFVRRVREATSGLEVVALWNTGPFRDVGDKLIRDDLGEDSLPRALRLLEHTRHASPTEFSTGKAPRMSFLTWHGGPLVNLKKGDLAVKVAPLLNGQVRQITFKGAPLLHVENNAKLKGFPLLGGVNDSIGTLYLSVVGEPSETAVTMNGEGGVSAWGSAVDQRIEKTVSISAEQTVEITAKVRHSPKTVAAKHSAVASTTYAVGNDFAELLVQTRTVNGEWTTVSLDPHTATSAPAAPNKTPPAKKTAASPEIVFPLTGALRIQLPAARCVMEDHYEGLAPTAEGKLVVDRKAGTLTTIVRTASVDGVRDAEVTFLKRRLRITEAVAR